MKKLNLSMLLLMLIASLTAPVFAEVLVNGTSISEVRLNGVVVTDVSIVQSGSTLTITSSTSGPNPCADPEAASCPGSTAFCAVTANKDHKTCPGSALFCAAHPADVSCEGSAAYCAVPANASKPVCAVGECPAGTTVFETLNWSSQPMKTTITTGKTGVSSKFVTTGSRVYKGYFMAVADSQSAGLTRRMWFSECPGGAPIVRTYTSKTGPANACDVSGVEPKLSWSQEAVPSVPMQCRLDPNKRYYLNHSQAKFSTAPTSTSKLYRSASVSGTP